MPCCAAGPSPPWRSGGAAIGSFVGAVFRHYALISVYTHMLIGVYGCDGLPPTLAACASGAARRTALPGTRADALKLGASGKYPLGLLRLVLGAGASIRVR